MGRKRYFFFDIDNTLLVGVPGGQYLPESAREAIDRLRAAGHFVAIATGRSHAMAEQTMRTLGILNMVSDGGSGLTLDGELVWLEPLDHDACMDLVAECEAKGIAWAIQPDDSLRRLSPSDRFAIESQDAYMVTETVPGLDPASLDHIYKMYVACPYPVEDTLESLAHLPWCRYNDTYFFVEPTDKARGIRKMLEHVGGRPQDVVVFGDGLNDMTMFIDDWTCIAMGNGADELKARATYVTADAADDGILLACEHFGWI